MKRLSTILVLLFIAHNLFAQRKSRNAPQSFWAIETGVPILNKTDAHFPIPLNIEWQRKNKQWGFGANIALQYDRYSWGDCSIRPINTGFLGLGFSNTVNTTFYHPYCETSQYLNLKPSIFGSYYFLQKKRLNFFAKLGGIVNIPILEHEEGEYSQIEEQHIGSTVKYIVKDAGPIHIKRNLYLNQTTRIGLLSGLGVNYFLNKRTSLRFTLQSEWYSDYFKGNNRDGSLIFALGGVTTKI
jgi:hypothetical protein